MALSKMGKKKWFQNLQKSKKQVSCPQYFYNKSHIISYYQLKKFVTTNCGNGIAEIGKKKLWQYHCRNSEKNKSDKLLETIALPKQKKKKLEIPLPKQGEKIFSPISAIALP